MTMSVQMFNAIQDDFIVNSTNNNDVDSADLILAKHDFEGHKTGDRIDYNDPLFSAYRLMTDINITPPTAFAVKIDWDLDYTGGVVEGCHGTDTLVWELLRGDENFISLNFTMLGGGYTLITGFDSLAGDRISDYLPITILMSPNDHTLFEVSKLTTTTVGVEKIEIRAIDTKPSNWGNAYYLPDPAFVANQSLWDCWKSSHGYTVLNEDQKARVNSFFDSANKLADPAADYSDVHWYTNYGPLKIVKK